MDIHLYFSDLVAKDFTLPVIGGNEEFSFSDFLRKSDKFILLHFGCVELFQSEAGERYRLEKLQSSEDIAVIWIYLHKTAEDIGKYALDAKFPMLHDPRSLIPRMFYIDRLPSVYLLAPDGRFAITDMHSILPQPISETEEWKNGNIAEILDKATLIWENEWRKKAGLVDLAEHGFRIQKRYFHYGWTDDPKCMAKPEMARALVRAREYLRHWNCFKDYNFLVWDAYRDYFTHKKMVESFRRRIAESKKGATPESISAEVRKYASATSRIYPKAGSHRQGTSVDLTLINDEQKLLDMGTDHDELSEFADSRYFENLFPRTPRERDIHCNRMLLREMMEHAGFSAHEPEWWHFDHDDR